MLEDASDRRLRERELRRLADTDPLTQLHNRRGFSAELERHLARGDRYGEHSAVLVLDIDGLKTINDTHGHLAGDNTIIDTATLLRNTLRGTDVVARMGGDEFAVLLPAASAEQAVAVARALLHSAGGRPRAAGALQATLSIGIATSSETASDTATLLEDADQAMYEVKRAGGNGYAMRGADRAEVSRVRPSDATPIEVARSTLRADPKPQKARRRRRPSL
jgi:diguanylate cyclase (GGDEF)-like protein